MKKVFKSRIFIVIITMIICISGTLYATNIYQASEVIYNPSNGEPTNVNDALNEIYNIKSLGDATEEDILEGKTAVVQGKLITGINSSKSNFSIPITLFAYGSVAQYGTGGSWSKSCQGKITIPLENAINIVSFTVTSGTINYNGLSYISGQTVEISKNDDSVFTIEGYDHGTTPVGSYTISSTASFLLNF